MSFQPIESYGVIGNMRSIALVGLNGSIDFLCYPNFDSPTIFANLLDVKKGGRFQIQPEEANHRQVRQLYLPNTNILLTRFLAKEGVAELTDFMPISLDGAQPNEIVRTVSVVRGKIDFKLRCDPQFDYARCGSRIKIEDTRATFTPENGACPQMVLHSSVPMTQESEGVTARFKLKAGEKLTFVFGEAHPQGRRPEMAQVEDRFHETARFWRTWIGKSKYRGRWREIVNRSALVLKMMISREHGSLIAAPTFSLPEEIGGVRNWDYRYAWLRDGAFTLYALIRLGFVEESDAFIGWLQGRLSDDAERGPLQVVYRVDGQRDLEETTLDHLSGYENSAPVRIGNAGYKQLQLDIYGEMMDSLYLASKYGDQIPYQDWQNVLRILAWLGKNWQRADEGIWEVRGGSREFLHSRLMCWVAFDRALRLAEKRSLSGPVSDWRRARDAIREDIFTNFWDAEVKSFVQSKGTKNLDASVLLMPLMRFISPVDPMWRSTMKAIEERLVEDTLVHRYEAERTHVDGVAGGEGTFTACSFWYIECLARTGQLEKAQLLFEKMLGYANHLGLYSEELGANGQHLGNFPQALTHLALISAATYLDRALSGTDDTVWR